ncbi:MAG: protein kinase [Anaerolineales bacterium]|nr:protein kinase [Anaerolineales bacterium]
MPEPLKSGYILKDRYVIKKPIGRGGMGSLYLADDNRLEGRRCAIKEVQQDSELPSDVLEQARAQFYREASVLAQLDHPTLPKVSDYFSDDDRDYLVMDYVPGDDLKSLMDQARRKGEFLQIDDLLSWGKQLADALVYLHNQDPPVIHRDIKPSNLKLNQQELIKLVDFGLVKQLVPDELTITIIQGRGTALYTPLEQYGGDSGHTDKRSDIYAFGATFYHLLTNTPPPEAKQRFLMPESLLPPRDINPSIPRSLEQLILNAMALHPDGRPDDMLALQDIRLRGRPVDLTINVDRLSQAKDLFRFPTDRFFLGAVMALALLAIVTSFL